MFCRPCFCPGFRSISAIKFQAIKTKFILHSHHYFKNPHPSLLGRQCCTAALSLSPFVQWHLFVQYSASLWDRSLHNSSTGLYLRFCWQKRQIRGTRQSPCCVSTSNQQGRETADKWWWQRRMLKHLPSHLVEAFQCRIRPFPPQVGTP